MELNLSDPSILSREPYPRRHRRPPQEMAASRMAIPQTYYQFVAAQKAKEQALKRFPLQVLQMPTDSAVKVHGPRGVDIIRIKSQNIAGTQPPGVLQAVALPVLKEVQGLESKAVGMPGLTIVPRDSHVKV